mmetsp:Transcript_71470/g.207198  ORF Transcript_71470/g.207198 Transcript_71470/m.207198 type:complete len:242 (-) Transcript_71470:124-849(-)
MASAEIRPSWRCTFAASKSATEGPVSSTPPSRSFLAFCSFFRFFFSLASFPSFLSFLAFFSFFLRLRSRRASSSAAASPAAERRRLFEPGLFSSTWSPSPATLPSINGRHGALAWLAACPRASQTANCNRAKMKAKRQEPQMRTLNHRDRCGPTVAIQPAPHFAFAAGTSAALSAPPPRPRPRPPRGAKLCLARPRVSSQWRRPDGFASPSRMPGMRRIPVGAAGSMSAISLSLKTWTKAL